MEHAIEGTSGKSAVRFGLRAQFLALLVAVLAAYFPAVSNTLNSIDDPHIVAAFGVNSTITLQEILLPGQRFYYRPVVELTYYLDNLLWGMDPRSLHLENVLLHLVNTLLVFFLAREVASPSPWNRGGGEGASSVRLLPFLSALMFALHPVNSEAVAWVAGRTDPLAASFVLGSALCLVRGVDRQDRRLLFSSLVLVLVGALAKEVAIAFLPAGLLLAYARGDGSPSGRRLPLRAICAACAGLGALFLGHLFLHPGANSVARLFEGKGVSLAQSPAVVLKTFGFYLKKLLLPAPLNFAVAEVPEGYLWLGLLGVGALLALALRRSRDIYCALLLGACILIAPALFVSLFKIAWTPVAERYLYLPSAFFSIAMVGLWCRILPPGRGSAWGHFGLASLLVAAFFVTGARAALWSDNLALYQDTVLKSPRFGALRNELALALFAKGRHEEAVRQLEIGKTLDPDPNTRALMDYNLLLELRKGKTPAETRALLHDLIRDKKKVDVRLLVLLRGADSEALGLSSDSAERGAITRDLIDTNDWIFAKNKDAACLYNNGQLSLSLGDRAGAVAYFRKAYQAAPADAHFKEAAGRLALKLGRP